MEILVNEQLTEVPGGATLRDVVALVKPDADVVIVNGSPAGDELSLAAGDTVALIRRGEVPTAEELEGLLVARHTPGVHERVRLATVGIAGVGGLGSAVAVALARTGVGRLVIADHDVVEPSNLNRQQYFVDQIGMAKVDALSANLARINPYVDVVAHPVRIESANVAPLFTGVDVMVEAFDAPRAKAMLAEAFRIAFRGTPLVTASGLAGFGPADEIGTRRAGRDLYVVGDGRSAAASGSGLMAPRVGVAAHHQASVVLRLLLGLDPLTE